MRFSQNKNRDNRKQKGALMVEVLVVCTIMTVSILAAMAVAQKSIYVARQSLHVSQASFLLEEGAEVVRILRDNDWVNISALTAGIAYYPTYSGGIWSLSTTPNTVGIFTRSVTIADVERDSVTDDISASGTSDPGTKLVEVEITWSEGGSTVQKSLQFYILDIF